MVYSVAEDSIVLIIYQKKLTVYIPRPLNLAQCKIKDGKEEGGRGMLSYVQDLLINLQQTHHVSIDFLSFD